MELLGRNNVLADAGNKWISLRDYAAVTFVCLNAAGDTYTLNQAVTAAGGSSGALATIDRFHVQATNGAVWALVTQTAASTMIPTASQDVAVVTINASELSDTYGYVRLAATGSGTVCAILHDPLIQRNPVNLPALV